MNRQTREDILAHVFTRAANLADCGTGAIETTDAAYRLLAASRTAVRSGVTPRQVSLAIGDGFRAMLESEVLR